MSIWTTTYAQTKAALAFQVQGDDAAVIAAVKQAFPQHALEFEDYTDQIDVFTVRNGKRRKFMVLMAEAACCPYHVQHPNGARGCH